MNDLIKSSLDKLRYNNIPTPEIDLRILLKFCSDNNNEIILSNLKTNKLNIQYKKI